MAGIQAQAGVLTIDGQQLTTKAKQRFVQDVIDQLSGLEAGLPCGPTLAAVDSATLQELFDEQKFPEFHQNYLGPEGAYTKVAKALDVKGAFIAPPFIDPFALFNIPGIPDIPPKFEFTPPELLQFVLPYINVSLPDVQLKLAALPGKLPLPLPLPTFDIDPRFTALIDFNLKLVKFVIEVALPKLVADLALKIPQVMANIQVELPALACSALDGVISADPRFLTQIVALKVLANKTSECIEFDAVGLILGCPDPDVVGGPGFGLVGAYATTKGLGTEADEETVVQKVEQKKEEVIQEEQTLRDSALTLLDDNVPSGFDVSSDPNQTKFQDITQLTLQQLKGKDILISTCGFLPHWLLHRLGCREKDIVNRNDAAAGLKYEDGKNLGKLRLGAKKLGAWVTYKPELSPEPGDIVLIQNDSAVQGDPIIKQNDGTEVTTSIADYTSQHVFVFMGLTESTDSEGNKQIIWKSADAGLGGLGTQRSGFVFRERKGKKLFGDSGVSRDINGWVDISKLPFSAAAVLS